MADFLFRLIYQSAEPSPVIILEDVSGAGFSVVDKSPDDFEVSKKVVRRLAKYHAATFYLAAEKKFNFEAFDFSLFKDPMMKGMLDQAFSAFVDVAKTWNEFEKFVPSLESFKNTYTSRVAETYSVNRTKFAFNVVNHADFHLKNILFRKNADGAIDDLYIVSLIILLQTIFFAYHSHSLDRLSTVQLCDTRNRFNLRSLLFCVS